MYYYIISKEKKRSLLEIKRLIYCCARELRCSAYILCYVVLRTCTEWDGGKKDVK